MNKAEYDKKLLELINAKDEAEHLLDKAINALGEAYAAKEQACRAWVESIRSLSEFRYKN